MFNKVKLSDITDANKEFKQFQQSEKDKEVFKYFLNWYKTHNHAEKLLNIFLKAASNGKYSVEIGKSNFVSFEHPDEYHQEKTYLKVDQERYSKKEICNFFKKDSSDIFKVFRDGYLYHSQEQWFEDNLNDWDREIEVQYSYDKFLITQACRIGEKLGAKILKSGNGRCVHFVWGEELEKIWFKNVRGCFKERFSDLIGFASGLSLWYIIATMLTIAIAIALLCVCLAEGWARYYFLLLSLLLVIYAIPFIVLVFKDVNKYGQVCSYKKAFKNKFFK